MPRSVRRTPHRRRGAARSPSARCRRKATNDRRGARPLTLTDLAALLRDYASGELALPAVHARLRPVLAADPLDVAASDATRWDARPQEERLFWRLVYLLDTAEADDDALRAFAGRIVAALDDTASAEATHELLPLLADQPRLCTIVAKHDAGVISRTGFLSVVAESGYPAHVKLWLEHASPNALRRLAERLETSRYAEALAAFSTRPD